MCIYFIHNFFECLLFLSCWSDHASTACKCTVWSCALYFPFEMNQGKCMFLTDLDWTISSGFIYVYYHWVRANNWDKLMKKKYINSLSEHCWMILKMLNSRGGAIFLLYLCTVYTTNSNKSFACISSVKMLAHWDWHQNHYCYIVLFHHDRTNWSLWRTCVL